MNAKYPKMFEKARIGNLELKNRIMIPAMELALGDETNQVNDRMRGYYEARAKGGAALMVASGTAVDTELCGITVPGQVVMDNEEAAKGFKELTEMFHSYDCKFLAQMLHPGRQANPAFNNGQTPVAPSAIPENETMMTPRELTTEEVQDLVRKFVRGSELALSAGVDGIEIHAAHGYLPYQFMVERANKRTDQYGGSFENRMRFIREIAEGVKKIMPENAILSIRFDGVDYLPGGIDYEEGIKIAKYLEDIGFDMLNVSLGTYSNMPLADEGYLLPEGCRNWVKGITDAVNIPVASVNHVKHPEVAEKTLQDGVCDFIMLARANIADPEFVNKLAADREDHIRKCIGCCQCLQSTVEGHAAYCSVNPCMGREYQYNDKTFTKTGNGRRVVVIGGGPGGMEGAIIAAKRGFEVTLIEKEPYLGGNMVLASKGTGKDKVTYSIESFIADLKELNVDIRLNTEITSLDMIKELNPYAILVSVGGIEVHPPIPGSDGPNVMTAHQVLRRLDTDPIKDKKVVLIGCGLTGSDTAEVLMSSGNSVDVFDMTEEIAANLPMWNRFKLIDVLNEGGVRFHMQHKLLEIKPDGVITEDMTTGEKSETKCDLVVLSLGNRPNMTLAEQIKAEFKNVFVVGNCVSDGKIMDATRDAMIAMWNLA